MAGKWRKILHLPARGQAPTDDELVRQIQQGDQQAWSIFLERYTNLIYARARTYSRHALPGSGANDPEDETAELYLFLALELQKSLRAFRFDCQPSTWVHAVLDRRKALLKAYLRHKDPHRADVRIPRALENHLSALEEQIFRHLVWGLEPEDIPLKLEASRQQCEAVESRVAQRSPQVYERILENRSKRQPHLSLEINEEEEETPGPQVPHPDPPPDQVLEQQSLKEAVHRGLHAALKQMSTAARRVLILLYNREATVEQIVALAGLDDSLGLGEVPNANRVYYLKDRGLETILKEIYTQLEKLGNRQAAAPPPRRELLQHIEQFILEQGLPEPQA